MTPERFQKIAEVFRDASGRHGDAARSAYLDDACADDDALRVEVERLLRAEDDLPSAETVAPDTDGAARVGVVAPSSLLIDAAHAGRPRLDANIPHVMPERIGRYRLRQMLEEGGMGRVYVAVQAQPHRTVALKVMKASIASKSALRRFEYESQILARLRHPHIAQVYEAGVHEEGTYRVPYFAMEYVPNAKPLTAYAREKDLGTRTRLELFAKVCDAVHHGHQKGIIHRDLKPSNVLVDSSGAPKIIDFGVARATDSDLAVTTVQTDIGQLIGTLQYMSPEQCAADPHDLDTRSDVYALGVMLYELLCDRLPYDLSELAMHEATRRIVEDRPARPSTLDKTLRGDVETIVLRALEKDRDRRYQSAAALGKDIGRYLRDEAIDARPPSVSYQLRVFARRNKTIVGAAAAVFLVLIVGILATTTQTLRARDAEERAIALAESETTLRLAAESEATRALRVQSFLQRMLDGLDPGERPGYDPAFLRPMYDDAARWIDQELADEPDVAAELHMTVGRAYVDLRAFDHAERHLEAAVGHQREHETDELALARGLLGLGHLRYHQSRPTAAEDLIREAHEINEQRLGPDHEDTVESLLDLAWIVSEVGRFEEAEALDRLALERAERALGDDHWLTGAAYRSLGFRIDIQGRSKEAESLLRRGVTLHRRVYGADHPRYVRARTALASNLVDTGQFDEAERIYREALVYFEKDQTEATGDAGRGLARVLVEQGRYEEAAPLYEWILAYFYDHYDPEHRWIASVEREWGRCLTALGRFEEAETLLLRSHDWWSTNQSAEARYARLTATRIIELYDAWGQRNEADAWRTRLAEAGGPP